MRKAVVLIILLFVIVLNVFPMDIFSLSFGANISYNDESIENVVADQIEKKKFNKDNVTVGLEARTNLLVLEMDIIGEISVLDQSFLYFSGIAAVGVSYRFFDLVKLGFTLGPKVEYLKGMDDSLLILDGQVTEDSSFFNALNSSKFNLRATVDVVVGPVISVGCAYTLPTQFTIKNGGEKKLLPEDAGAGNFSLCIQMKLV